MWGPWLLGMASAQKAMRFERVGLQPFTPRTGLTIIESILMVERAEFVAASFKWEHILKSPISKRAVFRDMISDVRLDRPNPTIEVLIFYMAYVTNL